MWCDNAIRGLRKPSDSWKTLCMGYTHADGLPLRTKGGPSPPERGGNTLCAKKWHELMSTDMEFPSSPSSSICWPHLSVEEATLRGRLKQQFRLWARLALSTSPTQIPPIVIIMISSERLPVRNIRRKMMGGCNVMCWHHAHLMSPSLFQSHLWWQAAMLFLHFPAQNWPRIKPGTWNKRECTKASCMCAWVCVHTWVRAHTDTAHQCCLRSKVGVNSLNQSTVHPSPVFAGLVLLGKTNFVNRASIRNIDLRRANDLHKKRVHTYFGTL